MIVEGQPELALVVELLLAGGKEVAEEQRVVRSHPVEEQASLPREVLGALDILKFETILSKDPLA